MNDEMLRGIASIVSACLFCIATFPLVGALQQGGYKNGTFWRWLKRKDNLHFNRLCVLALCLGLSATVTAFCFSFLGKRTALILSAIPFWGLTLAYCIIGTKYALKVPTRKTGRVKRLFVAYVFLTAVFAYAVIALLWLLAHINGSVLYGLIAYLPFALFPLCLPVLLAISNAVMSVFENARNAKFVKRAGQVLNERNIIRVAVVGSYGKTTVKNILKTILSEKYAVIETPESYNTPMGIAKTVFEKDFSEKEVFIAEMGARKSGDIEELCEMVRPNFAIFTGVCEQHIATFDCLENIWNEKKKILQTGAVSVCGEGLKTWGMDEFGGMESVTFIDGSAVKNLRLEATRTLFTLSLGDTDIAIDVPLLGENAVENIVLAATLAHKMGLSAAEIERGIQKIQPIPHRLQLIENGGVWILDDAYNGNPLGAERAIDALCRFEGRKCLVTPGIVECGILEESVNGALGRYIAKAGLDQVLLVGETLVTVMKNGYSEQGGDMEKLKILPTLQSAQDYLADWLQQGDAVLFLNDLPDVY